MQDMGIKILFEGDHLIRLLEGMGVTLRISLVSAGGSVILGMIFGMLMMADHAVIRWVSRIYLEFVRIMPQLVLLFLAYFGAAGLGSFRRTGGRSGVYFLGNGRNGGSGARRSAVYSQTSKAER